MLKNYLTVAFRNLRKQRGYTVVNVTGLALGLACSALIALFVRHEHAYDRFHERADRIVRVTYEEVDTPAMRHMATTPPPLGPTLAATYPEVRRAVRLREPHPSILARGPERFYERDFFYADSTFFRVFTFPLRAGDAATALAGAGRVVLTPAAARKYFGEADPMGQTLTLNDEVDLTVTGVLEPLPHASQLQFDFLVSFETFRVPHGYPVTLESWTWSSFHTYLLLAEGADAELLEARLPDFMGTYFDAERARTARLRLQPLTDVYLGAPRHPAIAAGNATA
ncbi:MAG: ABC transporter permease, partial [Rhodothermales bacterium]|nr:ABC transporter permease [Rhodothermales bacterium]